ncbi:MAG TPA: YidC/Oxa1 family membrane protein insertase [Conexibacter sp.]|jgi:YidC/Oxa1 family membrane protein insertase|nr:YidC/Oxa1 family membrane protein insertase [Conexibacter sp.]
MFIPFANPLQPLIDVCEQVLLFFHDNVGVSWGFSIILLTVTVRLVLLPLTLKQVTSMQRLQVLAPEMRAIQAKYREDKQRQQQEMMKFYKENRVNPLASCLPLLFQLPFFIALYYMLRSDLKVDMCPGIEGYANSIDKSVSSVTCTQFGDSAYAAAHHITVSDPSFLFIPDLTAKATGAVLVILIVMYVASQLASGLLSSSSMDRNQRMIMLGLPIVFVTFIINFPAGLLVYWITTNVWTIVQQLIVRKTVGVPRRPALATAGAPAGAAALARGGGKDGGIGTVQRALGRRADKTEEKPAAGKESANGASASGPPPSRRKKKRTGRRR